MAGKEETLSFEDAVRTLIASTGDDPTREGLSETPGRVRRAFREWYGGYAEDPATILKSFEDGAVGYDAMVIVHGCSVVSTCEHHLCPFIGRAHVAYIPNGKIVGLSKLPRLVSCFSRRLQTQERISTQVADALVEYLRPLGVAVLIRAEHTCMTTRGIRMHGSTTTTSALRGVFLELSVREEFFQLCAMAENVK